MDDYRDVHNSKNHFSFMLSRIKDSSMSKKQKEDIVNFIEDLRIGKAGAKVKEKRINNYLQFIIKLSEYFKKDFDKITEKESTQFYKDLQDNKIKKQNGMPFSEASKDEYIKTLKRFLGWKWGREDKRYNASLRWMKTGYSGSNKKAITSDEAEKIVSQEANIRNKCLFSFLFDSGARIEEALNVRISDLKLSNPPNEYYIVHLRGKKTEEADRTIPIPLASKHLHEWIKEHPTGNKEDFLFPIEYDNARKIIKLMSNKTLKFILKPHELRHSSATHYIQHGGFGAENIGGFYYRYGWKFGSKEALTYIKTYMYGGELGHKNVVKHILDNRIEGMEKQISSLKETLSEQLEVFRSQILYSSGKISLEEYEKKIADFIVKHKDELLTHSFEK